MDNYLEQILKAKPVLKDFILFYTSLLICLIGGFVFAFINGSLGLTLVVFGVVISIFARSTQDYEYEYAITNGDVDVAKITNRSSRKDVYSFEASNVERVLAYESDKCKNELQVNSELKKLDFTSHDKKHSKRWYTFFVTNNNFKDAVTLELTDEAIEQLKKNLKLKFEA